MSERTIVTLIYDVECDLCCSMFTFFRQSKDLPILVVLDLTIT